MGEVRELRGMKRVQVRQIAIGRIAIGQIAIVTSSAPMLQASAELTRGQACARQ
jgi:hypothetical protein